MNRPLSMNRVIIKQGYLKKMPNAAKLGASFKVKILDKLYQYILLIIVNQVTDKNGNV